MNSKVSDLLNKINQAANQQAFPQLSNLEFDLLLQHLRSLYDELNLIRSEKKQPEILSSKIETVQPTPVIIKEEAKQEVISIKENIESFAAVTETKIASKFTINEIVQSTESLNSKIKSTTAKEVHQRLSGKPLKELLDLNKRFMVTKELFEGNAAAFTKAVEQIDSAKGYSEAVDFIHTQLMAEHKWNETSETVQSFLQLVKQRFGEEK